MSMESYISWLNEDYQLYKPILDVQRDLCDGYVFASVLHQAGFEPAIQRYEPVGLFASSADDIKTRNLTLLEQRLLTFDITLPDGICQLVSSGDTSAIVQILHVIKDLTTRNTAAAFSADDGQSSPPIAIESDSKKKMSMSLHLNKINRTQRVSEINRLEYKSRKAADSYDQHRSRSNNMRACSNSARAKKSYAERGQREEKELTHEVRKKLLLKNTEGMRLESDLRTVIDRFHKTIDTCTFDSEERLSHKKTIQKLKDRRDRQTSPAQINRIQQQKYPSPLESSDSFDEDIMESDEAKNYSLDNEKMESNPIGLGSQNTSKINRISQNTTDLRNAGMERLKRYREAYNSYLNDCNKEEKPELYAYCSDIANAILALALALCMHRIQLSDQELCKEFRKLYFQYASSEHKASLSFKIEDFSETDLINAHFMTCACMYEPGCWRIVPSVDLEAEGLLSIRCGDVTKSTLLNWIEKARSQPDLDSDAERCCSGRSKVVTFYSGSVSGVSIAEIVARRHNMHFLSFDSVMELCTSASVQENVDLVAAKEGLQDILKPFYSSITTHNQKKLPLPDSLSAEVMATAVRWCESHEDELRGCILLNYPRTVGEFMQFEKFMAISKIEEDEERAFLLSQIETDVNNALTGVDNQGTPPYIVQSIGAVFVLKANEGNNSDSTNGPDQGCAAEGDPKSINDDREYDEIVDDAMRRFLHRCNRVIELQLDELNEAIAFESICIGMEVLTGEKCKSKALYEVHSANLKPNILEAARARKRSSMTLVDQFHWGIAARDFVITSQHISILYGELQTISLESRERLSLYFASIVKLLESVLLQCHATRMELFTYLDIADGLVSKIEEAFRVGKELEEFALSDICILLEVKLGDIIELGYLAANEYIEHVSTSPASAIKQKLGKLRSDLIAAIYPICLNLIDRTRKRVQAFKILLYSKLSVLKEHSTSGILKMGYLRGSLFETVEKVSSLLDGSDKENMNKLVHSLETNFSVCFDEDTEAESIRQDESMICENNILRIEIGQLIEQIILICGTIPRVIYMVEEIVAEEIETYKSIVLRDTKQKYAYIAQLMKSYREKVTSNSRDSFVPENSQSDTSFIHTLAGHLALSCPSDFLAVSQIEILVEHFAAKKCSEMSKIDFTETIIYCSTKYQFPDCWQSSLRVVDLAESFSGTSKKINWRRFVVSVLRILILKMPTIEEIVSDVEKWIMCASSKLESFTACDVLECNITSKEFISTDAWFDKYVEDRFGHKILEQVKSVFFKTIAKGGSTQDLQAENDQNCRLYSIIWLSSVYFSDPCLHYPLVLVHGEVAKTLDIGQLLPSYCFGIVGCTKSLYLLLKSSNMSCSSFVADTVVQRDVAIGALATLLEMMSNQDETYSHEQTSEASKILLSYLSQCDDCYYQLAQDCALKNPNIGESYCLKNPYSVLVPE